MLPSEKLAIAARLHVLLRRKTGRVTDTEWLAVNAEYAAEMARFARLHAREPGAEELAEWADRLEQAVCRTPPARRPLLDSLKEAAAARPTPARDSGFGRESRFADSQPPAPGPEDDTVRYVGGLR